MPIFAYRCTRCGFEKDVLQKRSDPPLASCPSCGQDTFSKQLTAPAFQLKGGGWYVTDFRDNGKAAKPADAKDAPATAAAPAADSAPAASTPAASTPAATATAAAPAASAPSGSADRNTA